MVTKEIAQRVLVSVFLLSVGCAGSRPSVEQHAPPSSSPTEPASHETSPPQTNVPKPALERSTMELSGTEVTVHLPPDRQAPMPGVVMLHSALGARPAILGYADDLAGRGYAVLALDLFNGQIPSNPEQAVKLRDEANKRAPEIGGLILEAYGRLATDERIRATRRYLVGWSYGAAWATTAASKLEHLSGTVAYYGQNFTSLPALYEQVDCPFLLVGALDDEQPSPATLREVERHLKDNGKIVDLLLVKGGHGFAEPTLPAYEKASADEAWSATLDFLER